MFSQATGRRWRLDSRRISFTLLLFCLGLVGALLIGGCPVTPAADDGTGQAGQAIPGPEGPEGPQGDQGPAGEQGPPGDQQGEQGLHGINGQDGDDGTNGTNGEDGTDGTDGNDGNDGTDGNDGNNGNDGDDGVNCWDTNNDGFADPDEDVNGDGVWDAADCQGDDYEPPEDAVIIELLADATGGLLTSGDLLDLTGQNLDTVDHAYVDDVEAPITAQTETTLQLQIPAGAAMGPNFLRLVAFSSDTGFVESIAAVRVHRLAVFLGEASDKIVIADTTDDSVIQTFDAAVASTTRPPYVLGFANQGSLVIIPTGADKLVWVDLTANPPTSGELTLADATELLGVGVSPEGDLAVVNDLQGDALYAISIDEALPPYATPISAAGGAISTGANTGPQAPTFASAGTVVVPLFDEDALAIFERVGDTLADTTNRADDGTIDKPTQVRLVPSRSMLVASNWGNLVDSELRSYFVGSSTISDTARASLGVDALAFDLSSDGNFAYVLPLLGDRLSAVMIGSPNLEFIAEAGDTISQELANAVAVQPVNGVFLYVGLTDSNASGPPYVDIFDITNGGTLDLRTGRADDLYGNADLNRCFGIGIQP